MSKLLTALNKFNGNLCFVGATDTGDFVFECDRAGRTLSYDSSAKLITDVALEDLTSYLVAFSDNWIGQFSAGVLNENYHANGAATTNGIKTAILYGSNIDTDFEDLDYVSIPGTMVQLWSGDFIEHAPANASDPQYINFENSTAYQYYIFRIADNHGGANVMGVRRIELQRDI